MSNLNSPFQSHAEGSFASLFAMAIEPYERKIERLIQANKRMVQRVATLEIALLEAKRKTAEVKKTISKTPHRMSLTATKFTKTHESYTYIVDYLRDTYKSVSKVQKETILNGTNVTKDSIRMELAARFDTRLLSPTFLSDRGIASLLNEAGLNGTNVRVELNVGVTSQVFSILMMAKKES